MMVMVEKLGIVAVPARWTSSPLTPRGILTLFHHLLVTEWDSATIWNCLMGRHPLRPKQLSKRLHKRRLLQVTKHTLASHIYPKTLYIFLHLWDINSKAWRLEIWNKNSLSTISSWIYKHVFYKLKLLSFFRDWLDEHLALWDVGMDDNQPLVFFSIWNIETVYSQK